MLITKDTVSYKEKCGMTDRIRSLQMKNNRTISLLFGVGALIYCILTIDDEARNITLGIMGSYIVIIAAVIILMIAYRKIPKIIRSEREKKRKKEISVTVKEISTGHNRYGQPYEQLVCIYEEAGKSYTFKSHKLIGVSEVKKGDSCKVLLDPENYNNYEVVLTIDFPAER